jgi:2-dehydropantoate 2-reductase
MQAAVLGAGAVGCFYGGMLARAGHAVTLIGRSQHVEALRRDGLLLEAKAFTEHVPVRASTEPSAVEGADLVLFCVKSADTEVSGRGIAPHLRPGATVLCLQNGVDNAERLRAVLPAHVAVVPAVVYVATEMAGPGHVKHHGRGELVIGTAPASAVIQQTFAAAGVPVDISANAIGALWAKLILNCAYNALSAIARQPYGQLVQGTGVTEVMRDVVDECLAVATAAGVTVPGDIDEAVRNIARSMPTQLSSTAQDLMRGKRSEIDFLNGFVVRKGAELGISTPANRVLHTVVRLLEANVV